MSLSDRKNSSYLSPSIDEDKFNKEIEDLKNKGINISRRNSFLIDSNGTTYQRENESLGEGSHGIAYQFTDIQNVKKNKVVKTDKVAQKWVKILAGLKEELRQTKKHKTCKYNSLIQAMRLDNERIPPQYQHAISSRIHQLQKKSMLPSEIIHWLNGYIIFAEEYIKQRASEWVDEVNLMQTIYGDTEILPNNYRISMPLLPGKTVKDELNNNPNKFPLHLLDLFINILHNYNALHLLFLIAHMDVKPDNILIDDNGCIWPCDFGLSLKFEKYYIHKDIDLKQSTNWAPEVKDGITIDAKPDIYGLGWIGNKYIASSMKKSDFHVQIPDEKNFHVEFKKICDAMQKADKPHLRITLDDAIKRLIQLRTTYFPTASRFKEKLNPIFRQKKLWLEARNSHDWNTIQKIAEHEFQARKSVDPFFLDMVLDSLEEKSIPEEFIKSTLNNLSDSKQWDAIRKIAEKLSPKCYLNRTFNVTLLAAARDKQWDLVEYLAQKKATCTQSYNDTGYSALHFAVLHQQHNVIRALLQADADTNQQNKSDQPAPIHLAINNNDPKTVKILLEHKLDINCTYQGKNVISYVLAHAYDHNEWECVNALLAYKNLPKNIFNQDILDKILASNNKKTIDLLINHPSVDNQYLQKLAFEAAFNKNWDLVQLLAKKINPSNPSEEKGTTLLHLAVLAKQYPVLKELLRYSADPTFQIHGNGPAPIHFAINNQDTQAFEILFNCLDADITYQNKTIIEYAIDHAINKKNWDIIQLIFQKKSPFESLQNRYDEMRSKTLDYLIEKEQWDIIKTLSTFEKTRCILRNLNFVTSKILRQVIDTNHLNILDTLLHLANLKMHEEKGILDYAIDKKNWDAVRIILSKILSEFPPVNAIAPILKILSENQPSVLKNLENEINNLIIHYLNHDDLNSISSLQKQLSNQFILSKNTTDALTQWERSNLLKGLPGCTIGGIIGAIIGLLTPLPGAFWFGMAIGFAMGGYTEKFIRDRFIKKLEFPMSMPQTSTENNPPSPKIQHLSLENSSPQIKRKDDFTMGKTQYKIFLDSKHTPKNTSKNKVSRVTLG